MWLKPEYNQSRSPSNCLITFDTQLKYLLLTKFELRTVSYGPSFFPFDLPKREARQP